MDTDSIMQKIKDEFDKYFEEENAPESLKDALYKAYLNGYVKATISTLKEIEELNA